MPKGSPGQSAPNLAGALTIGSEFVGFAIVGVLIDFALGNFTSIPWATLILSPLGLVAALVHLYQMVKPRPKS